MSNLASILDVGTALTACLHRPGGPQRRYNWAAGNPQHPGSAGGDWLPSCGIRAAKGKRRGFLMANEALAKRYLELGRYLSPVGVDAATLLARGQALALWRRNP